MKQYANIEASWKAALADVVKQDEMDVLSAFLEGEHQAGKTIYPAPHQYFAAFNLTPLDKVKVVILGQDPYHGEGQGHGLCFSVAPDVRIPPSLRNIYQELRQDLGITTPQHGCLASWAKEGVLLLNSVLTVEKGLAGSHQKQGWERFTDHIIRVLNEQKTHVVFILWGSYAQKKGACIDASQHLILKAVHPSPLSAYRGFFGGRYFSKTNAYLTQHGLVPIEWTLPADDQIETNVFKEKPFDKQMVLGEMK